MTLLSRRKFFLGALAAPAIVHIGNLMPVKAFRLLESGNFVFDAQGNRFEAYTSYFYFMERPDLLPVSWRWTGRIANVEPV